MKLKTYYESMIYINVNTHDSLTDQDISHDISGCHSRL